MEGNGTRAPEVTPLLFFTSSSMGFFMTTERQDFGLVSHPKESRCIYGALGAQGTH